MATLHTHLFLFIRPLSSSAYFLSFSSLLLFSLLPPHPAPSPDYSPPSHASSSSSNLLPSFFIFPPLRKKHRMLNQYEFRLGDP